MRSRIPAPLRVLIVIAALEAVAWAVVTPPLVGPDESAHFAYAQQLAENRERPQYDRGTGTISTEAGTAMFVLNLWPTVAAGSGRPLWSDADQAKWRDIEGTLSSDAKGNASGPNAVAKNPPLYYAYQAVPYWAARGAPVLDRVFVMRLANVLLFVATVVLTWLLAAELFASALARTVAAACVALHPVAAFLAGVVNPDTFVATWFAAFLLAAVRLVLRGPTRRRVLVLLAIAAAGALTHGRGLPLLLSLPAVLALAWWRHRPPVPRLVRWGAAAGAVLLVGGIAASLAAGRGGLYGGELRLNDFRPTEFASFVWQFYFPRLPFMEGRLGPDYGFRQMFVEQYLGTWGSLDVRLDRDTYRLLQLVVAGGLVALVAAVVRLRSEIARRWDVLAAVATVVVVALLVLHLISYRTLAEGGSDPLIVGRYLVPLTPVAGLAAACVVRAAGRHGAYVAAVVIALLALLQLGGLGASLTRFYA